MCSLHVNVGFFSWASTGRSARFCKRRKFHASCEAETERPERAALKQAHRYGVLGYKGARRKRLATCVLCIVPINLCRSLERPRAAALDHASQAASNGGLFSVLADSQCKPRVSYGRS